jgi:probable selenium-dependent hydroxylase accessory protein YqeC
MTHNLLDAFGIRRNGHELISLVGAGGKTTAMFALAQALKSLHKRVLVTTTTNIFYPEKDECDVVIVNEAPDASMFHGVSGGTITALGGTVVNERKLAGVAKGFIEKLHQGGLFDYILVECDGSKRKPIKAAAPYEPIVPANTTRTIGAIGLDAVGQPIDEDHVHRAEIFCTVVGRRLGGLLDTQAVVELIVSPQGLFKGVPETSPRSVLLNKADTSEQRDCAAAITAGLQHKAGARLERCVTASLASGAIYRFTTLHEPGLAKRTTALDIDG